VTDTADNDISVMKLVLVCFYCYMTSLKWYCGTCDHKTKWFNNNVIRFLSFSYLQLKCSVWWAKQSVRNLPLTGCDQWSTRKIK